MALAQRLKTLFCIQIGGRLTGWTTAGRDVAPGGEPSRALEADGLIVEALAGSTRHAGLTVVRLR